MCPRRRWRRRYPEVPRSSHSSGKALEITGQCTACCTSTVRRKAMPTGAGGEVPANIIVKLLAATLAYRDELNLREENNTEDPLTGVSNRRGFYRFALRADPAECAGVICCELSDVRKANRHAGHGAGDAALKELAHMLLENFRRPWVFRMGSSDFLVCCPGVQEDLLQSACWRIARHSPGTRDSCDGTNCMGGRHARWARAARAAGDVGLSAQPTFPNPPSPQPSVGLNRKAQAVLAESAAGSVLAGWWRRGRFSLAPIADAS